METARPTGREITQDSPPRVVPTVAPRVDIYETDTGYVLLADMPGVKADGVDVTAERDELIIRGRVDPRPSGTGEYQEFELGNYQRTFVLTEDLEMSTVSATLRDGVLRVEVPKSARVQPKKIPIRVE
jgi:HSP20 family molecular chaperone IbpA